jgi:DNA-directed RNA polymerase specialized sigma subunit
MEKVYQTNKRGHLQIKDSNKFLELLSGTNSDAFNKIKIYAKKNLALKAQDVPLQDQDSIIHWALVKTMQSFDSTMNVNLLTYFSIKLKGELSDYRNKRDSMTRKVHKMINEPGDSNNSEYVYTYDKDSDANTLEGITNETGETKLIADDIYRRKLQAFRMSFSQLPRYTQQILNSIVLTKSTLENIAEKEELSYTDLIKIRNHGLSLILTKVLRSHHLTDDEKDEIKKEHDL